MAPAPSIHLQHDPPRIDVLLPVRGARRTLAFAVADLLAQRGVAVRVIAVVDEVRAPASAAAGAEDASLAWLEQCARREPRLLVLRGAGRGAGAALDVGLAAVQTPAFAHMEADDRCSPERLARLHTALLTSTGAASEIPPGSRAETAAAGSRKDAQALAPLAAVVSRAAQFGARTPGMRRYLDWQNALLAHDELAAARFVEIPALHQTGLYRTAAVRAVGGYAPRGPWPPDIDFWLRWFEHDAARASLPVLKLPRVLYRWRQHAAQATRAGAGDGAAGAGTHSFAALRACKAHYLARLHGPQGAQPRRVLLLSTGTTLAAWRTALASAGVELAGTVEWKPGRALPERPRGALLLAAYGMAGVRDRLVAALAGRVAPDDLLFTA